MSYNAFGLQDLIKHVLSKARSATLKTRKMVIYKEIAGTKKKSGRVNLLLRNISFELVLLNKVVMYID
jgi:hypothetical protein